jgi:hypothetical protein
LSVKSQATDASAEMTQMSELFDKDFKVFIVKIHQQAIRDMIETSEKIKMKCGKHGN